MKVAIHAVPSRFQCALALWHEYPEHLKALALLSFPLAWLRAGNVRAQLLGGV